MTHSIVTRAVIAGLVFICGVCCAENFEPKVSVYDSASLEFGQVVRGTYINDNQQSPTTFYKGWQQRFLYRFITDAQPTERIRLITDIEGQLSFSFPQRNGQYSESETARNLFVPIHIEGTYSLGDKENPAFQFGVGYFPYKFNPDAAVLGEYLYRTGTYPLYTITDFNHPYGKLLGFRLTSNLFSVLKLDLMLTSETMMFPTQDYSLSGLAHYSIAHCLDIGAGICFSHLFTVRGDYTSGKVSGTTYVIKNGDTTTYAFDGIKPAAQIAFDPKPLFPSSLSAIFGKQDLRVYAETFVSGWEDRKNFDTTNTFKGYDNRYDRMPWMVGLNIPACRLLDRLSFELEHFPNKYDDTYRQVFISNAAIPNTPPIMNDRWPWKWSLYAKKNVISGFAISGMVGRDHYRTTFPAINISEMETVMNKATDWRWTLSFTMGI